MTPAIIAAKKAGIAFTVHEYKHDPSTDSYGLEAARALGVDPSQVYKTLVTRVEGQLVVALVPVNKNLDLKALASVLGAKKAAMAEITDAERATGYVAGGISPLGQRKRLPTVVDESMLQFETIYVSAGKRGLEIQLQPTDLIRLCQATPAAIAR
ncbi:MAG TPA: Cys-tRNA(Pro) deacylase [Candidatus Limnocylindrales bacterium]|nr:Cys-tRNA(Pro) deacylase [Candidatus Limnocylindrales bacterium]